MNHLFAVEHKKIVIKCERIDSDYFRVKIEKLLQYSTNLLWEGIFDFKKVLVIQTNNNEEVFCLKKCGKAFKAYYGQSLKYLFFSRKNTAVESRTFLPFIRKEVLLEDVRG